MRGVSGHLSAANITIFGNNRIYGVERPKPEIRICRALCGRCIFGRSRSRLLRERRRSRHSPDTSTFVPRAPEKHEFPACEYRQDCPLTIRSSGIRWHTSIPYPRSRCKGIASMYRKTRRRELFLSRIERFGSDLHNTRPCFLHSCNPRMDSLCATPRCKPRSSIRRALSFFPSSFKSLLRKPALWKGSCIAVNKDNKIKRKHRLSRPIPPKHHGILNPKRICTVVATDESVKNQIPTLWM